MTDPLIALRLDAEDRALLEECAQHEKLTKSDILRRALRAYAASLGVEPTKSARPKPKPKPKRK